MFLLVKTLFIASKAWNPEKMFSIDNNSVLPALDAMNRGSTRFTCKYYSKQVFLYTGGRPIFNKLKTKQLDKRCRTCSLSLL